MKHLIIIALALMTFSVSAQQQNKERKNKRSFKSDFTPEQIATLKTKRMALSLDLNESQKRKIQKLNLDNAKERASKRESMQKRRGENTKKLSSTEHFEHQSERLDKSIAHKAKMKNILSKEQYEKWEKNRHRKSMKQRQQRRGKVIKKNRTRVGKKRK